VVLPVQNNIFTKTVTTSVNTTVDIALIPRLAVQNIGGDVQIVTNPSHGTLGNINQTPGVVTYTPNQGFTGTDNFTYGIYSIKPPVLTPVMLLVFGSIRPRL
jgi:hypothetical protein